MWTTGLWLSVNVALALYSFCITSSTEDLSKERIGEQMLSSSVAAHKQVGKEGASTVFSIYNTSPESPDGKYIFHFRFNEEPPDGRTLVPGELWICDRNLKNYRRVAAINGMVAHNGPNAQWIDNNLIGLIDSGVIRVINIHSGEDILEKEIKASGIGHDSFQGRLLFTASASGNREPGIYELDAHTQVVRKVILLRDVLGAPLPSYIDKKDIYPSTSWRLLHCQYSPDGKKIAFRIDAGETPRMQLQGLCNSDGSDFEIQNKSLHFMWYDNESIVGHIRFGDLGEKLSPEVKSVLMRWNLKGEYVETMGPKGNHLAMSPDRKFFASESFYGENPVILNLIPVGRINNAIEIARFEPYNIVWEKRFHVNPSFSRDGKRVYYTRPLNDQYNGTFYYDIEVRD